MRAAIDALPRDPVAALEALLLVWREVPAPALGDAIDRLGGKLAEALPVLEVEDARDTAWLQRFAEQHPSDLPLLLEAAVGRVPTKRSLRKLESLLELPRDPRTTGPLLAWCEANVDSQHWVGLESSVFTRVLRLLAHHGDPRAVPRLKTLVDVLRRGLDQGPSWNRQALEERIDRFERTVAKLPGDVPELDLGALPAALEAFVSGPALSIEVARAPRSSMVDEVREQIYENVDDDGPIEVWADLLAQAGDPLGDFVTLQLADARSHLRRADEKAMERLQKTLVARLLGPLAPVVDAKTAGFRRGLLHVARVAGRASLQASGLVDHPYWRSVRQIHTSNAHLREDVLAGVTATGVRLVPTVWHAHGAPRGYRFQRSSPPGWSQLCWLLGQADFRPLVSVCAALPKQVPSPKQLRPLEEPVGLGSLQVLHLVESMSWAGSVGLGGLQSRLGRLCEVDWVGSIRHLLLDGFTPGQQLSALDTWRLLRRGEGQRLTVFDPAGATWTFDLAEREGLHLEATVAIPHLDYLDELRRLVPEPAAFASVTLRSLPWPARLRAAMATHLAGCPAVSLPAISRRK